MTQEIKPRIVVSRSSLGFNPSEQKAFRTVRGLIDENGLKISGIAEVPSRLTTANNYRWLADRFKIPIPSVHSQIQPDLSHFVKETKNALRRLPHDFDALKLPIFYVYLGAILDPDWSRAYKNVFALGQELNARVVIHEEELTFNLKEVEIWRDKGVEIDIENAWGPENGRDKNNGLWHPERLRRITEKFGLGRVLDAATFVQARRKTEIADKTLVWAHELLSPLREIHVLGWTTLPDGRVIEGAIPTDEKHGELIDLLQVVAKEPNLPDLVIETSPHPNPRTAIIETYRFIQDHIRQENSTALI